MLSTISSLRVAARRTSTVLPAAQRMYSDKFAQKESAEEEQYTRRRQEEQLKKLREAADKKKAELAKIEQEHAELEQKAKGKA